MPYQEGPGLPGTRIYPQLLAVLKRPPWQSPLLSVWVTFAAVRKEIGNSEVPRNSSGPCSYRMFPRDDVENAGGNPLAPDHGVGTGGELRAGCVFHPDQKHSVF